MGFIAKYPVYVGDRCGHRTCRSRYTNTRFNNERINTLSLTNAYFISLNFNLPSVWSSMDGRSWQPHLQLADESCYNEGSITVNRHQEIRNSY